MSRLIMAAMLAAFMGLVAIAGQAAAAGGYKAYADALVAKPPDGVKFRPDLEAYLDGLASSTRRGAGYKRLAANERLKRAARAQALDMALGQYVGHDSRNGYRFSQRFAAYADPAAVGYHGENAARDRRRGSVDEARARRLFGQWLELERAPPQPAEPGLWLYRDRSGAGRRRTLCGADLLAI